MYVVTLFLIVVLYALLKKRNGTYCIIMGIWLSFLVVCRNYTVGIDTKVYMRRFEIFRQADWIKATVLAKIYSFENGFVIFNKLIGCLTKSSRLFIIMCNLLIIYILCREVRLKSSIPWLSFFIFVTLGLQANSLNILRQFMAISMVFYSYNFIENRKVFKFLIMVLLASCFHISALIVIPMYWLVTVNYNKWIINITLLITFIIVVIGGEILVKILSKTSYGHLIRSGGGAKGLLIISALFFTLIMMIIGNRADMEYRNFYVAFALASVVISGMTFIVGAIERVLPYFSICFLISIPNVVYEMKNNVLKKQYLFVICSVLLFYYFAVVYRVDISGVVPYEFWNGSWM